MMAGLNEFGPLSICLAADWSGYKNGVFTGTCSHKYSAADHCVQLVGYDSTGSKPYWKVRNSWGSSWGEGGHIRLPMGVNSCGVANWPMLYTSEMISTDVTEGVESGLFMTSGKIVELSPQQIVDCDQGGSDYGCDGGDVDTGTEWVESAGGLALVKDYPETSPDSGREGQCSSVQNVVKVTKYNWAIPSCTSNSCDGQNESDMMAGLNEFGPLSICLAADWSGYKNGVFTGTCSHKYSAADHCVQLVGYDSTGSKPYWKVRNSWGSSWGEGGHIRLPMGVNSCGVANWPMLYTSEMISTDVTV